MTQFSPLLTGVLLLNNFVIAQYIGLRPVRSVAEAIGLGAATALALSVAAPLDWLLKHFVLQPAGLGELQLLSAALIAAPVAQIAEMLLRQRRPRFFPDHGHHLPLIITNTLLLLLTLPDATLPSICIRAPIYGVGFAFLLVIFQALRERNAGADTPKCLRGAALDMISAGLLTLACSGLAGLL